jgi:hypothetical protein
MILKRALYLFAAILTFGACDEEIDLTADWQDIPVVYGLINQQDTAHYIRIEKAFLDQDGNAFSAAATADSLYYEEIAVELRNLTTGASTFLNRVDGNLEGYPREEGVFASAPNYLYKARANQFVINGQDEVELIINRGDNLDPVTAKCEVVAEVIPQGGLDGADPRIDFPEDRDATFRWRSSEDARIFDLTMEIHYDEKDINNPADIQSKTLVWNMAKNIRRDGGGSAQTVTRVSGISFYNFLASQIEVRGDVERLLTGLDLRITAGGESLERYITIGLANTGITSSQEIPVFSNLSEGRGIFSSIYEAEVEGIQLTADSRTYLLTGPQTVDLNFQ